MAGMVGSGKVRFGTVGLGSVRFGRLGMARSGAFR